MKCICCPFFPQTDEEAERTGLVCFLMGIDLDYDAMPEKLWCPRKPRNKQDYDFDGGCRISKPEIMKADRLCEPLRGAEYDLPDWYYEHWGEKDYKPTEEELKKAEEDEKRFKELIDVYEKYVDHLKEKYGWGKKGKDEKEAK